MVAPSSFTGIYLSDLTSAGAITSQFHSFARCAGISLLVGPPGSRKSGLALQTALDLAARGERTLILLSEEHVIRVRERAECMMSDRPKTDVARCLKNIALLATPDDPAHLPAYVARHVVAAVAAHAGVKLVVLDSIQGTTGAGGSDAPACRAALDAARLLQANGIATLLVGHVTKQNAIRGPRTLEHAVDVVLHLDRRGGRRTLTVPKNRFGPAAFRPTTLTIDPVTTRLIAAPHTTSQIATAKSFVPGAGPVEIEVAAALPAVGCAGGHVLACRGLPATEVRLAAEILARLPGFDAIVPELDLTVVYHWPDGAGAPAAEARRSVLQLPLCLAIAGACLGRPVDAEVAAVGELDLSGRVRQFSSAAVQSMGAALRDAGDGIGPFLLVPAASKKLLPWNCPCSTRGVDTLAAAIAWLWPDVDLDELNWNC